MKKRTGKIIKAIVKAMPEGTVYHVPKGEYTAAIDREILRRLGKGHRVYVDHRSNLMRRS